MKKISVIIPAYNEEKEISQTVAALRAQNYSGLEVIVVVNNSTDNTYNLANQCADIALDFKENIGVCAARNRGAEKASADMLLFIDADTRLSSGFLLKVSENTKENIFISSHFSLNAGTFQTTSGLSSREERYILYSLFNEYDITAYFSGHSHSYIDQTINNVRYITTGGLGYKLSHKDRHCVFVRVSGNNINYTRISLE